MKAKEKASFEKHYFNEYKVSVALDSQVLEPISTVLFCNQSSLIPLDRAVPDVRHPECKSLHVRATF